jgi:hypothetical protein
LLALLVLLCLYQEVEKFGLPRPYLEVVVAVVENRWPDLPGILPGSARGSNNLKQRRYPLLFA